LVLLTAHRVFSDPNLYQRAALIIDTRNAIPSGTAPRVVRA